MLMPTNPASAEAMAPARYDMAVEGTSRLSPTVSVTSQSMSTARMTVTTTTNMASIRYSRPRKAMAPRWMASPMNCTSLLPLSCRRRSQVRMQAKARATRPAAMAM